MLRDLVELDVEVSAQLRPEILGLQRLQRDVVETAREFIHARARDRDAGSRAVSAEAQQDVAALADARVQVEGRDRTARSFPFAAFERNQDCRPAELLNGPRRDDAYDARMS